MRCGISTRLPHDQRLACEHLIEIARHGFEAIEPFATRSHFDYHNPSDINTLARWLDEIRTRLHSIHALVAESYTSDTLG